MSTWKTPHAKPFTAGGNPWRRVTNKRTTDTLTLTEVVVLRRLLSGMTQAQAARELGLVSSTVTACLKGLRARFEVATTAELLTLPRVLEQLHEDGAA